MNLTCINLVRSKERQQDLLAFGATKVWLDDDDVPERVRELTKGVGCTLGLNSVGGKSALRLARSLRAGGVHATFGAMERESIRFPTRSLIFDDIRFVGFWLDRWKRKQTRKDLVNAVEEVLHPLAMTEINHPIDRVFPLANIKMPFCEMPSLVSEKSCLPLTKGFLLILRADSFRKVGREKNLPGQTVCPGCKPL